MKQHTERQTTTKHFAWTSDVWSLDGVERKFVDFLALPSEGYWSCWCWERKKFRLPKCDDVRRIDWNCGCHLLLRLCTLKYHDKDSAAMIYSFIIVRLRRHIRNSFIICAVLGDGEELQCGELEAWDEELKSTFVHLFSWFLFCFLLRFLSRFEKIFQRFSFTRANIQQLRTCYNSKIS